MNFYKRSLHRELLENKLMQYSALITGKVLDLGSKNRRYDSFFKNADSIIAIDIKPQSGKGVIPADILKLPFKERTFDAAISFEVMEYIMDTENALAEISRALKNKSVFIFSVPFLDPVHGDIDCVRFTIKGWEELLSKYFRINKVDAIGGRYSLIWDSYFEKVRNNYSRLLRMILFPILASLKRLAISLDKKEKNTRFPMGYLFVCEKK